MLLKSLKTISTVATLIAGTALLGPTSARTLEEARYSSELMACAQQVNTDRQSCESMVQAKINADWKARIEMQARQRTSK